MTKDFYQKKKPETLRFDRLSVLIKNNYRFIRESSSPMQNPKNPLDIYSGFDPPDFRAETV